MKKQQLPLQVFVVFGTLSRILYEVVVPIVLLLTHYNNKYVIGLFIWAMLHQILSFPMMKYAKKLNKP